MEENAKSSKDKFFNFIGWLEKLLVVTVAAGALLNYLNFEGGRELLLIIVLGLAVIFIVSAYKPREIFSSKEEADEFGEFKFSDFLGLILIPRVLLLATGISTFGIFTYLAEFDNDGYIKVLAIGGSSILIAVLLLFGTFIGGTKKLETVLPILARALTVVLIGAYILFVA